MISQLSNSCLFHTRCDLNTDYSSNLNLKVCFIILLFVCFILEHVTSSPLAYSQNTPIYFKLQITLYFNTVFELMGGGVGGVQPPQFL